MTNWAVVWLFIPFDLGVPAKATLDVLATVSLDLSMAAGLPLCVKPIIARSRDSLFF